MCCEGKFIRDYCDDCRRKYFREAARRHYKTPGAKCFCGRWRRSGSRYCKQHTKLYRLGILEPNMVVTG